MRRVIYVLWNSDIYKRYHDKFKIEIKEEIDYQVVTPGNKNTTMYKDLRDIRGTLVNIDDEKRVLEFKSAINYGYMVNCDEKMQEYEIKEISMDNVVMGLTEELYVVFKDGLTLYTTRWTQVWV